MIRERVLGIDGCPGGWVGVVLDGGGRFAEPPLLFPNAAHCAAAARQHILSLLDLPIGLASERQGRRACDIRARELLGRKRASVFFPPVRAALHAPTYRDACRINFEAYGKKISIQSWNLMPRIRDVDVQFQADSALQARLRESHPELCFRAFNGGEVVAAGKRTPEGLQIRLALLARRIQNTRLFFQHACSVLPRRAVHADDLVDAMVLAATAWHGREHGFAVIPDSPEFDATGLRMEILYPKL